MKTTARKNFTSKSGTEINAGERVTISFTVKGKDGCFLAHYIKITTGDGRVIITRNMRAAGLHVPSIHKLEQWAGDSVCKSVFGHNVELDGWDDQGSPSWLLALCFI